MFLSRVRYALPVLQKELREQAVRKRTYILRIVYGLAFYVTFLILWYDITSRIDIYYVLGQGKNLADAIFWAQFLGIYLFLPVVTAPVISGERERNTLQLLLLSGLTGWEIILEKWLSRMIPMFTMVLLAVPPISLCYALGGLSTRLIIFGFWTLVLTVFQVSAMSIMVSSFCRSVVVSVVCSYILGFVLYLTAPVLFWAFNYGRVPEESFILAPPYLYARVFYSQDIEWGMGASMVTMLSILVFLILSRQFLWRRTDVTSHNWLLLLFKKLDQFFEWINQYIGNIRVLSDRTSLPTSAPVAWQEVNRKSLGKLHYLLRILLISESIVFFIILILIIPEYWPMRMMEKIGVLYLVCFTLVSVAVVLKSSSIIAGERSRQTIDVLLATPIVGKDVVKQKVAGLQRMIWIFMMPLLTIIGSKMFIGSWNPGYLPWDSDYLPFVRSLWWYAIVSVIVLFVYLHLFKWIAVWIGLRWNWGHKTLLITLLIFFLWCVIPCVIVIGIEENFRYSLSLQPIHDLLLFCTPITVPYMMEINYDVRTLWGNRDSFLILSLALYTFLLFYVRRKCLKNADWYLRKEGL